MPEAADASGLRGRTPGWPTLYVGFLITGTVTVLLGPLLPELAREWRLPVGDLRSLFAVQFLASALGSLISSYRPGASLVLGYLLIGLGLLSLAAAPWPLARAPVAALGLGLGLAIPATNLRVAHAQPTRRGAALSSLNLVWGLGAVACSPLFAVRPEGTSSDAVLVTLAAVAGLVFLLLARREWLSRSRPAAPARSRAISGAVPRAADVADARAPAGTPRAATRRGRAAGVVVVAAILFLYVGIENSVGGWLVSLVDELQPARPASSLWIAAGFWAALLGSRAATPLLLQRMSEPALYAVGIALAGGGLLGLTASGSPAGVAVSAAAAGAGLAPLFPLTVSLLAALTAATRSRNVGWVFALAGAGGAVLPPLTARLADGAERLAAGFAVPIAGLALLALLFGLLRRLTAAGPQRLPWQKVD